MVSLIRWISVRWSYIEVIKFFDKDKLNIIYGDVIDDTHIYDFGDVIDDNTI